MVREINNLNQELPTAKEWDNFPTSNVNKMQLVNLLVKYITSVECTIEKQVFVNNGPKCYSRCLSSQCIEFESLNLQHREADQKIPMHAVFAGKSDEQAMCVVADDTDVYINLLFIAHQVETKLYFRQGKTTDRKGITYHDVHSLANKLGGNICKVLPLFHALTGSDFTHPFFGRTKIATFRKMLKTPSSNQLLSSMATENVNINEVTRFSLHVMYNRPQNELSPGECRYNMLLKRKASSKAFPSSKALPPDQKSLDMKILRSTYVARCMVN